MPIFIFCSEHTFQKSRQSCASTPACRKLYFAKFRRELCFDANSACTARARVCPGHSGDRRGDESGPDRRLQRLPPKPPKALRRRGTEGGARRNVLRQHRLQRAVLATASVARQARRAGRPAGRRSRAGGRPGGQAGKQASEQASRQFNFNSKSKNSAVGASSNLFLRLRTAISKNSRFFDEECFLMEKYVSNCFYAFYVYCDLYFHVFNKTWLPAWTPKQ